MRSTRPESIARVSRRRITALLTTAPLAAQIASPPTTQKTPPQGAPAPAPPSATPDQRLQKAYDDVHRVSARLAKLEVPMNIEPSFAFKP